MAANASDVEVTLLSAEEMKEKGNEAFRDGNMDVAIERFSEAIDIDPTNPKFFTNRSLCYANKQMWPLSIFDARTAVELLKEALSPGNATIASTSGTATAVSPEPTKEEIKNLATQLQKAYFRLVKGFLEMSRFRDARFYLLVAFKECSNYLGGERNLSKELRSLEREVLRLSGIPLRPKSTDFEVISELGDGNFSKVYKAMLKETGKFFAIKTIERATITRMKRRHPNINNEILMEKRTLQKLDHPNIARLYSTFQDSLTLYYQMEFVEGGDLWSLLQEESADTDAKSAVSMVGVHWSLARFYLSQAIDALEHMHRRGIVHRDIKPENIMITASGHLRFIDFGTAKDLFETNLNGPEFVGTPEYMSPGTVKNDHTKRLPLHFGSEWGATGAGAAVNVVGSSDDNVVVGNVGDQPCASPAEEEKVIEDMSARNTPAVVMPDALWGDTRGERRGFRSGLPKSVAAVDASFTAAAQKNKEKEMEIDTDDEKEEEVSKGSAGIECDLWALGILLFQLILGYTPFHAPSPYLIFLRIKRAQLWIPGFVPAPVQSLIRLLVDKSSTRRLMNAVAFYPALSSPTTSSSFSSSSFLPPSSAGAAGKTIQPTMELSYDKLRSHAFFSEDWTSLNYSAPFQSSARDANSSGNGSSNSSSTLSNTAATMPTPASVDQQGAEDADESANREGESEEGADETRVQETGFKTAAVRVPLLSELCIRAVGRACIVLATATSNNGGIRPKSPLWMPKFTLLDERIGSQSRDRIAHYLRRRSRLHNTTIYRLFQPSLVQARTVRTDIDMKEYIGYEHGLQGHWDNDFYCAQLSNPLFGYAAAVSLAATAGAGVSGSAEGAVSANGDAEQAVVETEAIALKAVISAVNKLRPKFLIVSGNKTYTSAPAVPPVAVEGSQQQEGEELGMRAQYEVQVSQFRRGMARLSDTIPAVFVPGSGDVGHIPTPYSLALYRANFGADYFGFWYGGVRCVVLNSALMLFPHYCSREAREQETWLTEDIEQCKLCSTHIVVFTHHHWYLQNSEEPDSAQFSALMRRATAGTMQSDSKGENKIKRNGEKGTGVSGHGEEVGAREDRYEGPSADAIAAASEVRVLPKDLRLRWLKKLRHLKVKLVVSSALPIPLSLPPLKPSPILPPAAVSSASAQILPLSPPSPTVGADVVDCFVAPTRPFPRVKKPSKARRAVQAQEWDVDTADTTEDGNDNTDADVRPVVPSDAATAPDQVTGDLFARSGSSSSSSSNNSDSDSDSEGGEKEDWVNENEDYEGPVMLFSAPIASLTFPAAPISSNPPSAGSTDDAAAVVVGAVASPLEGGNKAATTGMTAMKGGLRILFAEEYGIASQFFPAEAIPKGIAELQSARIALARYPTDER